MILIYVAASNKLCCSISQLKLQTFDANCVAYKNELTLKHFVEASPFDIICTQPSCTHIIVADSRKFISSNFSQVFGIVLLNKKNCRQ